MNYYAKIETNTNLVIAIIGSDNQERTNDMRIIKLDSPDSSLIGKLYDEKTKTFVDNPNPPVKPEPETPKEIDPVLSKIETNSTGIDDLGSVVSDLSTALDDLASAFAELQEAQNG